MHTLSEDHIAELVRSGLVTETFRRLAPAKKLRVYEQAVRLFGRYGFDAMTVDELCRGAGISKGSFFQYCLSKTHLLEACVLILDRRLERWCRAAVEDLSREGEIAPVAAVDSFLGFPWLANGERLFYVYATSAVHHSTVVIEGIDLGRHFDGLVLGKSGPTLDPADRLFAMVARSVAIDAIRRDQKNLPAEDRRLLTLARSRR